MTPRIVLSAMLVAAIFTVFVQTYLTDENGKLLYINVKAQNENHKLAVCEAPLPEQDSLDKPNGIGHQSNALPLPPEWEDYPTDNLVCHGP